MEKNIQAFHDWLIGQGLSSNLVVGIKILTITLIIILLSIIADKIAKQIIVKFISGIVKRTKNNWDDIIFNGKVFNRLAHFAPALVVHWSVDYALISFQQL